MQATKRRTAGAPAQWSELREPLSDHNVKPLAMMELKGMVSLVGPMTYALAR